MGGSRSAGRRECQTAKREMGDGVPLPVENLALLVALVNALT